MFIRSRARASRRFVPMSLFSGDKGRLESRNLTAPQPGFLLRTPNPGILAIAGNTVDGPDSSTSGVMDTEADDSQVAAPLIDAGASATTTNSLVSGGSTSTDNSLTLNVNETDEFHDNNATTQYQVGTFSEATTSSGAPIRYNLVDISTPTHPTWTGQILVNGTITVHYTPPANGAPVQAGGAMIAFASALSGVAIAAPVMDPATGNANALSVTYPTVVGTTTVMQTHFVDDFEVNGGGFTGNFAALTNNTQEAIGYDVIDQQAWIDTVPGSWNSELVVDFSESVNAH